MTKCTDEQAGELEPIVNKTPVYRVYKTRWFVITVITLLNFSNTTMWLMFAPVANHIAAYYKITLIQVNWLSLTYVVLSIPFAFCSSWIVDKLGLRFTILIAAWITGLSATFHIASTLHLINNTPNYPLLLLGQIMAGIIQPMLITAPVKVSMLWFPPQQRVLATTIGTAGSPLGMLFAMFISPQIMNGEVSRTRFLMSVTSVVPILCVLLATFGICRAHPPTPPSAIAESDSTEYFTGIKQLLKMPHAWCLGFACGMAVTTVTSTTTLLQQILCPLGYSNKISSLCGAMLMASGSASSFFLSLIIDRTGGLEVFSKICLCGSAFFAILFTQVARFPNCEAILVVIAMLTGIFTVPWYSLGLEIGVTSTYPVAVATSSGFLIITAMICSSTVMYAMEMLAVPVPRTDEFLNLSCDASDTYQGSDYAYSNLVLTSLLTLAAVIYVLFFRLDDRREMAKQSYITNNSDNTIMIQSYH